MKTYTIYGKVTGLRYLGEVQASSLRDAEDKAISAFAENMVIQLCHQCAREFDPDEVSGFMIEANEGSDRLDFDGVYHEKAAEE